ncbi:MAG: PfkB family carbohydrate kinase [Gemmatimonadaceae bacterium]|nr:PfkB family carbohydrate kinase [Gemmatimonadaceae bacterium]
MPSNHTGAARPLIDRPRLEALLAAAASQHVCIVGDAMLDLYLRGDVDRISPEAPVPVVRVRERRQALGGAANVAQNVAALGAGCDLVAVVGDDRAGETLRAMLAEGGMPDRSLVTTPRPTTTKTRVMARSQQLVRFDEEDDRDLTGTDVTRVLDAIEAALPHATALVFEDYNKGVLVPAVIEEAVRLATARGLPVVVDPKYKNFFAYRGATVFKPNRRELESALGAAVNLDDPAALPATFERLGVQYLLLTLTSCSRSASMAWPSWTPRGPCIGCPPRRARCTTWWALVTRSPRISPRCWARARPRSKPRSSRTLRPVSR